MCHRLYTGVRVLLDESVPVGAERIAGARQDELTVRRLVFVPEPIEAPGD